MKKLAIVTTHPIQYNSPWFALLHQRGKVALKVFFTWSQTEQGPKYDPDFKRVVEWDIPLLKGFDYRFVPNVAKDPGSHHFLGLVNPSLNEEIEAWGADAVLVMGWSFRSHLACMRHFKGRMPVLFRGDSTLLDEKPGVKTFLRRVALTWVYRHVDKALYVGTNNKAYFKAHGLADRQLIPAFHAVDNERFGQSTDVQKAAVAGLREQLQLKQENFVVLFAGKFEPKKNPFFLLQLAQLIDDPQFVFLLVGNGPLEDELKQKSAGDARIRFLPFQNQSLMPALYRVASVFVLPSNGPGETWGLAANEAMAAGLPVVLSAKTGGAVDLVDGNGLVFEPGNLSAVKAYLKEIKSNPQQLADARSRSTDNVKKFSFLQLAEAIETACDR